VTIYSYEYQQFNCSPTGLKVNSKYWHGRRRVAMGRIDLTGLLPGASTASDSQAKVCQLPAGAVILGGEVNWKGTNAGLGAAAAFTIGDAFNCARFMTLTTATSPSDSLTCSRFNVMDTGLMPLNASYSNREYVGVGYECTCATDILVTFANGPAAGLVGHMIVLVEYSTE
jgi:hypothetical protein